MRSSGSHTSSTTVHLLFGTTILPVTPPSVSLQSHHHQSLVLPSSPPTPSSPSAPYHRHHHHPRHHCHAHHSRHHHHHYSPPPSLPITIPLLPPVSSRISTCESHMCLMELLDVSREMSLLFEASYFKKTRDGYSAEDRGLWRYQEKLQKQAS